MTATEIEMRARICQEKMKAHLLQVHACVLEAEQRLKYLVAYGSSTPFIFRRPHDNGEALANALQEAGR